MLVQVNYEASLAARNQVGIETVGVFMEHATRHAQESFWETNYDLMINLHNLAAEVSFNRGDFDKTVEWSRTVVSHAKQRHDTTRALVAKALSHGVKRDFAQGIRECRILLNLLGVKMRSSSIWSYLMELRQTKKTVKNLPDADILNMKDMESEDLRLAMKILQHGSIFGWNSDTTFAGLCFLRMMHLTAKEGWCEVTPYALSGYAFLLAALGQEKEAFRYSQLAELSSRSRSAQPDGSPAA